MNILSNLQEIANIIIRPSRYTYKMTDLGNKTFMINQKQVFREDFEIKNPRNLKIKVSVYSTQELKSVSQVLIYLHCNSGCRIQGTPFLNTKGLAYLKLAIQNDFAYVVFDFTGSGMSEGKYVSLGFYETIDLECVFTHLKSLTNPQTKFVLWGRSMGAVTGKFLLKSAINFLLKNKQQVFMAVFDSPFRSLKQLFVQIGRQKTSFPDFILEMAYNYLKPIILQKAQFDIEQVGLKLENNTISAPGIFVASKQDSLVPFQQIDEIFGLYKGDKEMVLIEEGHNEARNFKVIGGIFKSIKKQLEASEINERIQFEREQQKRNYISPLGGEKLDKKQLSKKKLQLTIKSLSQRQLLTTTIHKILKDEQVLQERKSKIPQTTINIKISLQEQKSSHRRQREMNIQQRVAQEFVQGPTPQLQKKTISCLLPQHKKSLKVLSIQEEDNRLSFQESDKKTLVNNKSESKLKVKRKPFQIKNFFGNQNLTKSKEKDYIKIEESNKKEGRLPLPKTQPLREKIVDNSSSYTRNHPNHGTIKDPFKSISAVYTSKPFMSNLSPQKHLQGSEFQLKRPKLQLGQSSNKKPRQKQEPHSQIKKQNHKINCHEDFVNKEKQFLKRCESLQKIFKVQEGSQPSEPNVMEPQTTHTYREIKCTERVLEKIIEKQERKLLILNLQSIENRKKEGREKERENREKQKELREKERERETEGEIKERKTLQHVINKKPPFVELKGIKNFRNSLQTKYKTQIRK